ncbi:unnamed protein product [Rotaria sordida]|uniref:G-protein coupled receptors family 1 profile domain-containing protein n=1 Tax=Rotaria sordida TaxID=392033 RepID=A0A814X7I6_9BILA|nr:unnamed protein product [Rotaria sordida]CAF3848160.1 unnamed protein product [Rotaria sordida]
MARMQESHDDVDEENILSRNNLSLCKANYFETCWCKLNSTEPVTCPYLLRYVVSSSNSSYFCVYHTIRKVIECFNSTSIFSKIDSISIIYIYLTIFIFTIGFIGNGLSIIILFNKKLRCLGVYRNLTILCTLNIFYLLAISIRHINTYNRDLRHISPQLCRLHTFIVAFTGHLCSWQLVSTSIQRVHALLSLDSHRTKSWTPTLVILIICIILPLFIFDAQILFNYGILYKHHMCDDRSTEQSKQFQRATNNPINNIKSLKNISIIYHKKFFLTQTSKPIQCTVCFLWNIIDTFIYAIIPFLIILTSSIIIIIKINERRRSMVNIGGKCHTNRRILSAQDNSSILLIVINCLFLIMTGPFNISLIIQSISNYFFLKSLSIKFFLQLNQCLRLLQNSYHALSFIFYCVIGKKFRSSAWSLCQSVCCKSFSVAFRKRRSQTSIILRYFTRKRFKSIVTTRSTSTNDDNINISNSSNINLNIRKPCTTYGSTQKRGKILKTTVQ